jgi:predicted nucleotidyltransferase component of viral defense system
MDSALTEEGKKIFPMLGKFNGFYLAGGTGLALQIGHRVSVDFDLFSQDKISKNLLKEVEKVFVGCEIKISVNNSDELTVFVDGVKITFLYYPFSVYSKYIETKGTKIITPESIAFTKAYSIGRRGAYKDYVDLFFLLEEGYISLEDIILNCQKIFGDGFSDRLFLEQLVYMDDVDEAEIPFLRKKISKKDLEAYFAEEVGKFAQDM